MVRGDVHLLHALLSADSAHCPLSRKLLLVVAELHGLSVADAAERGRLHLPVVHGVVEQANAVIECPLHPRAPGAEVVHSHVCDVVDMEVNHLE